jgi:hypothetical protein
MNQQERDLIVKMALGRIFLLGSRSTQPGDVETYEDCRRVILEALDPLAPPFVPVLAQSDPSPNIARSHLAIVNSGQ